LIYYISFYQEIFFKFIKIILDYSLPDIDGKAVCKRLKSEEETEKIPVIFLTARITPNTVIDCYDVGAEHYLVKPISPSALIDQIEETLGTKSG
jgi:DNA-binding response OmpR family regulator